MPVTFGLQSGLQDTPMAELQKMWRRADAAGFGWISVWDHLYTAGAEGPRSGCFEGVSTMAALAAATEKARVGCLLFCTPFRNPALLARAAVTIDHISNGRCELGMGAGWRQEEFDDHGWVFGTLGERMAALEEALHVVRGLLAGETVTLDGQHYRFTGAVCRPRPVQAHLPLWVGGTGPRRTPRLAAHYADGLNVPFLSPEETAKRFHTLEQACAAEGRDPAEVRRSVNVEFHMGADAAQADRIRKDLAAAGHARGAGSLLGTAAEAIDRIGEYERAGAQSVNIAIRPPLNWEAFEAFIAEVMPRFA